jgi:Flp pilus assembly protein TadG
MVTPTRSGPKKWLFLNASSFRLRDFRNDQRGTIAVMAGLSGTVLVGFGALAIDVGSWQVAQRSMQGAADAAAYSAGIAYNKIDGTNIVTQAEGIAAAQGYVGGASVLNSPGVQNVATLVTVTVNQPPKSGPNTHQATAIEVIIQQPQTRFFASLFLSSNPTVTARAVATMLSPPCLLALNSTQSGAIAVSGSSNVNSAKCDIASDSNSASAITMTGSAAITTPCLIATGNVQVTPNLVLTQCTSPTTGAAATADPYASLPAPTPSGSCLTPVTSGNNLTFSPGKYCGIQLSGSQSATFQPGVYYVDGNFKFTGSATASGTGVTFFITAPNLVDFGGNRTANFAAPTSGTYSGIVFFGDRAGISSANNKFNGGSTSTITGVIYFPTQGVTFAGGSASGTDCTQIVSDTIKVTGSSYFSSACVGVGMVTNTVHLVE